MARPLPYISKVGRILRAAATPFFALALVQCENGGIREHPALQSPGARSPAVAITTFVSIASSTALLERDLSTDPGFRSVAGPDLLELVAKFEKEKGLLIPYPRKGWSERSEDLLRGFTKGSPITGFLDAQNPTVRSCSPLANEDLKGGTRVDCSLLLSDGTTRACSAEVSKTANGWIVDEFWSVDSSAQRRLSKAISSMKEQPGQQSR